MCDYTIMLSGKEFLLNIIAQKLKDLNLKFEGQVKTSMKITPCKEEKKKL